TSQSSQTCVSRTRRGIVKARDCDKKERASHFPCHGTRAAMYAGVLTGGSWPHYGEYRRGEKGGSVSSREAYRNTLTYALAIAGDEVKLAALLKIRVPQLMN